jgi:hypothetical protein
MNDVVALPPIFLGPQLWKLGVILKRKLSVDPELARMNCSVYFCPMLTENGRDGWYRYDDC